MLKYYIAKVKVLYQDVSGKSQKVKFKTSNEDYLVKGQNISHAETILKQFITGIYDQFTIVQVKESKIMAVIEPQIVGE